MKRFLALALTAVMLLSVCLVGCGNKPAQGGVDEIADSMTSADGKYEITLYTSCCNASKGIYYYTTYENHQITAVDMHKENLDGDALVGYAPIEGEQIYRQN